MLSDHTMDSNSNLSSHQRMHDAMREMADHDLRGVRPSVGATPRYNPSARLEKLLTWPFYQETDVLGRAT